MSTSAQIVARAMNRLRLLDVNEDPSDAESALGIAALNAMVAGWSAEGVNVSADVPLPSEHEEGVVAMLAVRLSDDFGATPGPIVIRDADNGWKRLQASYISAPLARFDTALRLTPAKPLVYFISLDDWVAATAYSEFDRVAGTDGRRAYECISAGTSDATGNGPASDGPEIVDGTVTWRFIGYTN